MCGLGMVRASQHKTARFTPVKSSQLSFSKSKHNPVMTLAKSDFQCRSQISQTLGSIISHIQVCEKTYMRWQADVFFVLLSLHIPVASLVIHSMVFICLKIPNGYLKSLVSTAPLINSSMLMQKKNVTICKFENILLQHSM